MNGEESHDFNFRGHQEINLIKMLKKFSDFAPK